MSLNNNVEHHGVNAETEIKRSQVTRIYKDPINSFFSIFTGRKLGYTLIIFGALTFILPTLTKIFFLLFIFLRLIAKPPLQSLPLYIPKGAKQKSDPHNLVPSKSGRTIGPSDGISYMGVERQTGHEVWITSEIMRRHMLYVATTGGGKSVTLQTFAISFSLVMGSGYSYTDGKAQLDLAVDHGSSALRFNRALDYLVVSYITGGMDSWNIDDSNTLRTNTFNFYSSGSYSELNEINSSLLDAEDDVWGKRAVSFLNALTLTLVYLRDIGEIEMSVESYLPYLNIEAIGILAGRTDLPEIAVGQLKGFIRTIPGVTADMFQSLLQGQPIKSTTVFDQFGYVTMQIIPLMNMLSGDYSHIFKCLQGHVAMKDVVINRRILLILLPALEKSSASLASLGRISMAAQKSMMGSSLGNQLEGNVQKNLKTSATSAMSPFPSFCDEVGYYFVEGTAVAAAQSRSLWIMMVYCGQDLAGLRRLSEMASKETDQVIGNTVTKMGGYLLDSESIEMFNKQAGEAITSQIDRMDIDHDGVLRGRHIANQVNMVSKSRVNVRDFNNLIEGEAFVLHKDHYIQIDIPQIKAATITQMALNDFIPSPRFSKAERTQIINKFTIYKSKFSMLHKKPTRININKASSDVFNEIRANFESANAVGMPLIVQGISVFTCFQIEMNKLLESYFTEAKPYSVSQSNKTDVNYIGVPTVVNDEDVSGLSSSDVEVDVDSNDSNDKSDEFIINVDNSDESNEFASDIKSTINDNTQLFANVFTGGMLNAEQVKSSFTEVSTLLEPELPKEVIVKKVDKSIQNIADASGYPGKTRLEKNPTLAINLLQRLQRDLQKS